MTKKKEVFMFLDNLRETGEMNMFGAVPLIIEEYGFSRASAKEYLFKWMKQ